MAATIGCYNYTKFQPNPLDGYGEIASKCYAHTSVGVTTFTEHVHFEWSRTKVLITPKLKELPRPTFGFKLPLLGVIILPNFIRFRWTVMEKWSVNVFTHICACSSDVLYPLLSFRTHNSSLEGAIELKFVPICSSRDALCVGITFRQSQNFQILAENHGL